MKKVILIFSALFSIIFVATLIFIATFDVNRYKGQVEQAVEKAVGEPVTIGRIGLQWQGGIVLQLSKVAVSHPQDPAKAPGIFLENLLLRLEFLPLLKKSLQVSSIVLDRPSIEISREVDGSIRVGGLDFSKQAQNQPKGFPETVNNAHGSSSVSWSIDSIKIHEGRLILRDSSRVSPLTLEVQKINIHIPHFSLTQPFSFEVAASVLSQQQNIRASGSALLKSSGTLVLRSLEVATDLKDLDFEKTLQLLPSLKGLRQRPEGVIAIKLDEFELPLEATSPRKGQLEIKDGKAIFKSFPIENMNLTAQVEGAKININSLTGIVAGAPTELSGTLSGWGPQASLTLRGEIQNLSLEYLMREVHPNAPRLQGHLTLALEGQARGTSWEDISRSLDGRARLLMSDGVLLNYNILREIVQKISIIPGAEAALQANFPQAYRLRLQDRSTVLRPVDLSANIVDGVLYVDPLRVDTDFILIYGAGGLGLDRNLNINANLILNQEISRAIVGAFNPLQVLGNNRGEIVIPVAVSGELPQVKITPDSKYIASKLLAGKTQEVIQDLIADPKGGLDKIEDIFKKNLKNLNI